MWRWQEDSGESVENDMEFFGLQADWAMSIRHHHHNLFSKRPFLPCSVRVIIYRKRFGVPCVGLPAIPAPGRGI